MAIDLDSVRHRLYQNWLCLICGGVLAKTSLQDFMTVWYIPLYSLLSSQGDLHLPCSPRRDFTFRKSLTKTSTAKGLTLWLD